MCTHKIAATRIGLLVVIALACGTTAARAQTDTFAATAAVKGAGGVSATAPVTIVVQKYATDQQRDALLAAVKAGGSTSARTLLAQNPAVGNIVVGSRQVAIKYAYARTTGSGRLITVVTAEPIVFLGAGVPGAQPRTGYEIGIALLDLTAAGSGSGELIPAADAMVDERGSIVTKDYDGGDVVRLTDITRK
jgi:hypothetical protein